VIGPLFFIIYINDLSWRVNSKIRLFSNDAVIYRDISDDTDAEILSSDLNNVQLWCQEWGLE
jgi:HrpA-like RNA helicase